jgi:serine/threonine protein kinase
MAQADHKYRVIKRLEAGGMAEVYLGEAVSVQGFKKKVAIKRVLPHLAQNESFIEMFLDEARLSARLNHTNIVSVFDISKREDTYFLIMEFIDGVNLKRVMESLTKRGQRMRLGEAVHLCIEACRGLSYAHDLTDENGKPLGIVHRDISPPNIMVTRRGEVKLADFGLAKASTQIQTTDPGVVKGKFSYLSPEAANGLEVDARADIFALGIVLWEMLAGKRLFWGENDYATVKLIQKANIPRLAPLNREVDENFEEVLARALARDPRARYQTAREFGEALSDYIFSHRLMVSAYDLANMVESVTGEDGGGNGDELSLIDRLIQEELDESIGIASQSGSLPVQGDSHAGSGGSDHFEDPASWFSDDNEVLGESQQDRSGPQRTHSSSWRESGLPPADGSAQSRARSSRDPMSDPTLEVITDEIEELTSLRPAAAQPKAAAVATATAVVASSAEAKPNAGKYVLYALLAAAAGALAWFGTRHF